jgi:hypothetical protein
MGKKRQKNASGWDGPRTSILPLNNHRQSTNPRAVQQRGDILAPGVAEYRWFPLPQLSALPRCTNRYRFTTWELSWRRPLQRRSRLLHPLEPGSGRGAACGPSTRTVPKVTWNLGNFGPFSQRPLPFAAAFWRLCRLLQGKLEVLMRLPNPC